MPFRALLFADPTAGWPMVSILLFIGGIHRSLIGSSENILVKFTVETKQRPVYIILETEKKQFLELKKKLKNCSPEVFERVLLIFGPSAE